MSKILIAITTRNRSDLLEVALHYHNKFIPKNHDVAYFVYDDESNEEHFSKTFMLAAKYPQVSFTFSPKRLGVAGAKNECLKVANRIGSDYIFLWDDDSFPQKEDWEQLYIDAHKKAGINHLAYVDKPFNQGTVHDVNGVKILAGPHCYTSVVFLTKEALEKVGGYNPKYGYYGYEHISYSNRMHRAGMTGGLGQYVSLPEANEYIYAMDFDKRLKNDVEGLIQPNMIRSSVENEDSDALIKKNQEMCLKDFNGPIFQEYK